MIFSSTSYSKEDLLYALIGGVLIGVATSINYCGLGRITGNSGILNTLVKFDAANGLRWKFSFFVGLIYSGYLMYIFSKDGVATIFGFDIRVFDSQTENFQRLSLEGWIIGGLLVGIGTKLGNGCTSGHGVCGLPRFAKRSLVAVLVFMATCALTATLRYQSPFFDNYFALNSEMVETHRFTAKVLAHTLLILFFVFYLGSIVRVEEDMALIETPLSFVVGIIFGIGLCVSGMTRRSKIYGFFTLNDNWDPSLAFVMMGAVLFNAVTFSYIRNVRKRSLINDIYFGNPASKVDFRLISGAAIFGVGWGITGMCPGPAMINLFNMPNACIFIPAVAIGQIVTEVVENMAAKVTKQKVD